MSEKDTGKRTSTAVAITGIICSTIMLITVAGMIFSWAMVDHAAEKLSDVELPSSIVINNE